MKSASYTFPVEIARNEVVFKPGAKEEEIAYYKIIDLYTEKEEEIKHRLLDKKFSSNAQFKAEIIRQLELAGLYYFKNKLSGRFSYRTPIGVLSANKTEQSQFGEEDEFYSHTVTKYEVSILLYGTSEYS